MEEKKAKKAKKEKEEKEGKRQVEPQEPQFETVERPPETPASEIEVKPEESSQTIGLLMDVELDLSVLLGSCELPLKKVLDLTKGSIIELDSTTNNPIDLLANGKVIARGEVVIIEDNFGLRITNMVEENAKLI